MKLIWKYAEEWQKTKQEMLFRPYEMVLADSIHEEVLIIQWYLPFLLSDCGDAYIFIKLQQP